MVLRTTERAFELINYFCSQAKIIRDILTKNNRNFDARFRDFRSEKPESTIATV